jgi:uncharacterized protein with PIN domain
MGQAKLKGTLEHRIAQALAKARAQYPASVKCNNCSQDLTDIQSMDVRGMPGMRLAGAAICSNCSQTTWILDGSPEALEKLQAVMDDEHGEEAKKGFVTNPQYHPL